MPNFSFLILYVDNPPKSAGFYADLLGRPVREQSPTFAMLPLSDDTMLGLWSRQAVEPAATGAGGASEIAFTVADAADVGELHREWAARGLAIAQAPTAMDFGTTFVALDPDGHRLRVFAPGAGS
ncbi:VOC family protein [Bradyrhizobium sp. STM 3557]|uniref:VOC family protein n=1 Tax=Bradyrhizobium sp. STM 3557 TaxID=578920 RepID=UPI00388FE440